MTDTVSIPCDADYRVKPWVAKILGRDPKTGYKRQFWRGSVSQPGLFEATARKNRRNFYLVVRSSTEGLVRLRLGEETLAIVVDQYLGRLDEIEPFRDEDGTWRVRREDNTLALRALGRAVSATDLHDALSRIEASARYLTDAKAGQALGADELRAAIAGIRDVARDALGMTE